MRIVRLLAAVGVVLLISESVCASAFVRGAYYRLGDDDPGASVGALGNDPTKDSFLDNLDLSRFTSPHRPSALPPARGSITHNPKPCWWKEASNRSSM